MQKIKLDKPYYTVNETAKILNRSYRTIYRWIENGTLKTEMDSPASSKLITRKSIKELLHSENKKRDYYTIPETMKLLKKSLPTITRYIRSGKLKSKLVKENILYSKDINYTRCKVRHIFKESVQALIEKKN